MLHSRIQIMEWLFNNCRCKLFYQKDGAWVERGVGYLHLKKADDKAQLLVRADTTLGKKSGDFLLVCLFGRKSWAIVIARSLLLSLLCKNFNVSHYSKSIKDINTKLGILVHHDEVQLQGKEHNYKAIFLELCPFLTTTLIRIMAS